MSEVISFSRDASVELKKASSICSRLGCAGRADFHSWGHLWLRLQRQSIQEDQSRAFRGQEKLYARVPPRQMIWR